MPVLLPSRLEGQPVSEQWQALKPSLPEFDVAIIGGGSAGYAAARTAAALGASVVVSEGGKEVGGLCILRGCMPSKAFLESAHRWHDIQRAKTFGLVVQPVEVDMKAIQARKRFLVDDFAGYRRQQLDKGKFTFIRGFASFLDGHTLLIEREGAQELLTASTFIISTGSVITHVPIPGLWEAGCWTSDDALEAETIPKRLAVLGGGVIAVEAGQFFSRVGSKTTLLQRSDHLVRGYDPDVGEELVRALRAEGMEVRTGVKLIDVEVTPEGKKIRYEQDRQPHELVVDEILYAMGRAPALKGLKLENADVALLDGKLPVNAALASSAAHIFGAGDVVGPHEVVHIAIQQGEIAARNAVNLVRGSHEIAEKIDYRLKALVTFTDPEIASVGLTETEAKREGIEFLAASFPFNDLGKALIGGHEYGFVKLLAEKSRGEIIGAEIIGPRASDLIHELIAVMRYRGTAAELAAMPHYHPTLAEIITYPAEELAEKLACD